MSAIQSQDQYLKGTHLCVCFYQIHHDSMWAKQISYYLLHLYLLNYIDFNFNRMIPLRAFKPVFSIFRFIYGVNVAAVNFGNRIALRSFSLQKRFPR